LCHDITPFLYLASNGSKHLHRVAQYCGPKGVANTNSENNPNSNTESDTDTEGNCVPHADSGINS
jgi:hypothetical protein